MQANALPYPTWKAPAELRAVAQAQREQAATMLRDLRAYEALQLEAEQALEALRLEPFAPRFDEAEREQALRLEAFRAGARDCAAKAQGLEEHAAQCEALASEREAAQAEALERAGRTKVVRRVEVESFGIGHAQYFRGAGAEDFAEVYLGVGDSEREALADALEALACSGWKFKPEDGYPSEPSEEDYSERDEVSEAVAESRRDNVGSEPEPRFRVALYPHNGSGPYVLAEGLGSRQAASSEAARILARKREDGYEVSELKPCASWEVQYEGSGVSDSEGLLEVEPEPDYLRELKRYEERAESFDEEPSELHYYVAVRVDSTPEGSEESDGLTRYEDSEGREYLFAPDFETAQRAALQEAKRTLWAFGLDFLAPSFAPELRTERALSALRKCAESLCEDFGPVVEGLLGSKLEAVLAQAVREDGLAHFLASYDGAQLEDEDGALRFRVA